MAKMLISKFINEDQNKIKLICRASNIAHWFNPDTRWMGFLHIPLLVLSIAALIQTRKGNLSP